MRLSRTAVKVCASRQDRLYLEPAGRCYNAMRSDGTVIRYLASLGKLIFGRPPTARLSALSWAPAPERPRLFRRR